MSQSAKEDNRLSNEKLSTGAKSGLSSSSVLGQNLNLDHSGQHSTSNGNRSKLKEKRKRKNEHKSNGLETLNVEEVTVQETSSDSISLKSAASSPVEENSKSIVQEKYINEQVENSIEIGNKQNYKESVEEEVGEKIEEKVREGGEEIGKESVKESAEESAEESAKKSEKEGAPNRIKLVSSIAQKSSENQVKSVKTSDINGRNMDENNGEKLASNYQNDTGEIRKIPVSKRIAGNDGIPELLLTENNRPNNYKILTILLIFVNMALGLLAKLVGMRHKPKKNQLPPISEPLLLLSASEITEKIKNNTLKCEQIVRAYIDRIKQVQVYINAVVDANYDEAIKEAKNIDESLKDPILAKKLKKLPLLGVPFTCKDSISCKGLALTAGSLLRKGFKAEEDAPVIKNMRNAGAILLAITNTPEFVMWWDSDNKLYGRTCNPYDLSRIVGGSSGGEGALIASAGSLCGVGSDVAGSIRIPSMFNGIFGHKTTSEYVPWSGMFPPAPPAFESFVCFGPICRYAKDLPLMFKAMSGGLTDKLELDKPVKFEELKIYYMEWDGGNPLTSWVDKRVVNQMQKALDYFSSKYNVKVEKININKFKFSVGFFGTLLTHCAEPLSQQVTCGNGRLNVFVELFKSLFGLSNHTLAILLLCLNERFPTGNTNSKTNFMYQEMLNNLKPKVHKMLGKNAVLFYPTWPTVAVKHQTTILRGFDATYTVIMNALNLPATHCQMGITKEEGLPIGFQVAAAPGNDRLTLAFALEIEKKFGGWVAP